jgi:uncharacterized protein (DUF885 family)
MGDQIRQNTHHAPFQGYLMQLLFSTFLATLLLCSLQSCASPGQTGASSQTANRKPANPDAAALIPQLENSIAEHLFQQAFDEMIARSPERQTYLGIKGRDHLWNNRSAEYLEDSLAATNAWWQKISNDIDYKQLNRQNKLSYQLLQYNTEMANQQFRFRYHNYPVHQPNGLQASVPSFLINIHPASSVSDLEAYIARLEAIPGLVEQLIANLEVRQQLELIPARFILHQFVSDSSNILSGRPFDFSERDSVLLEDFRIKVNNLGLIDRKKQQLLADMSTALIQSVKPGYTALISYLLGLDQKETKQAGVWQLPDGDAFYRQQLLFHTTTNMTPEQIHNIGLMEVARIQAEMQEIILRVNFDGKLQAFFEFIRQDSRFYFPASEQGKQAYLTRAVDVLAGMNERLGELFFNGPNADLIVKAVESFRERSAEAAFYTAPAVDGSRPGIFYINLYDMRQVPKYELEAQIYHGGIPGHHLERSMSQQLAQMPDFRRFESYTAFTEGWGLYMEYMPKQIGLYPDPYSDFGRLARELWHACALVADTGIHWGKWTREQAIEYLDHNTPGVHIRNVKAIDRYLVRPGQAPAYTIGKLKFLELQNKARDNLGADFDIHEYHQVVLANGPLPLALLGTVIDEWIKNKKE